MEKDVGIREYQGEVDRWVKEVGVRYFFELTNLGILLEEAGEVARIMTRVYGDQSFKRAEPTPDLGDELADLMFVLVCIANQTGVDLPEAISKNMEKKSIRDKTRHWNNPKLHAPSEAGTREP